MSFRAVSDPQNLVNSDSGVRITVRKLTKWFNREPLYQDFNLEIEKSKVSCIFGPNGCGKSTLLNAIAGLVPIDSGQILFDGKTLHETRIGYVFQNYRDALYPWLKAIDNIKYPLKVARYSRIQQRLRVEELVGLFDTKIDLNRYPYELSGGQQQLVSIMRALAIQPAVLFLDEPFSALDYEATLSIRDKLQDVFQTSNLTTVMISHDLEEAVYMADNILLMTKRPTQIAEIVKFNSTRPRKATIFADPKFIQIKSHCLEVFQKEVRR
ncbi:MAG: Nitrate import ATP-binding protein NrtD [Chroococcidiopsis cubana SAG 39.79]|uniref:Sulfonate ABC transporter ATP-binding lipoprotein n=1 Tax=Chroococcidiopsis cubana SAG 39.79 TaxID=388085 RepID=A0AB37UF33_9CYAN|nr:ABC transporter ATP-binding protein [Chroococcidiopsis cubana]MDZ4872225.1 Nitrate import ATP-binding protein NrtD [Chroococcidiopsis cubana SAG 39.79]PSB64610.1 nitrate ABC transporter ATP-binding protein [Chroococcidiopsis cubana CCALA 043]RUT07996.1 sulfonate ABC transporter ATP-binding lipoprotein [Chroococcidiopsis cubana SAG 39.79]